MKTIVSIPLNFIRLHYWHAVVFFKLNILQVSRFIVILLVFCKVLEYKKVEGERKEHEGLIYLDVEYSRRIVEILREVINAPPRSLVRVGERRAWTRGRGAEGREIREKERISEVHRVGSRGYNPDRAFPGTRM